MAIEASDHRLAPSPNAEAVATSRQLEDLQAQLAIERQVYDGARSLLEVFEAQDSSDEAEGGQDALRRQVEGELRAVNERIARLQARITFIQGPESSNGVAHDPSSSDMTAGESISSQATYPEEQNDQAVTAATELLNSLPSRQQDDVLETINEIGSILQRSPQVQMALPVELAVTCVLPLLADTYSTAIRATSYRLLRHFMNTAENVDDLRAAHLDIFLVKALSRDHRCDLEKQQVIRTIRHALKYPGRTGIGVVKAVVALAENGEDKLRLVSLELLAELVICDIDLLAKADGLKIVLQALADGPYELAPSLAALFLHIADLPRLRRYLRPGVDLEMALAGLTEMPGKSHYYAEKTRAATRVVTMLLKSWSGLLYLCTNDRLAIKGLVQTLYLPAISVRETMLDTLFDIFRVKTAAWFDEYLTGKRLTMFRRSKFGKPQARLSEPSIDTANDRTQNQRATLVDQYIAVLMLVFVDAGLLEALVAVAEETKHTSLSRKAALLIGEILQLSNRILPLSQAIRMQALPRLFELAAAFDQGAPRLAATTALQSVDSFNRNRSRLQGHHATSAASWATRPRGSSIDDPVQRGQRSVETAKVRQGMQIDDNAFRNLLVDSQVLTAPKEHARWSFAALLELFEGPLLNPTRFEEVNKGSKLLRRIMAFYHPFEGRFSELARTKDHEQWAKLATAIISCLVANPEGVRFLAGDKLLRQVADCLIQLDPLVAAPGQDTLFTKQRMESTMCYAYIDIIGVLSRSADGQKLIERFHLFTLLYHVTDLKSREDLMKTIVGVMDYSIDGHTRVLFAKALTSSYKHVRLLATEQLGKLFRENSSTSKDWLVRLLLTQLYDPALEVCQLAVSLIEEACSEPDMLALVVEHRPALDHLGEIGAPLLFKFLASPLGVRYLHSIHYVDRELEDWFVERNHLYVVNLELQLARFYGIGAMQAGSPTAFTGAVPPHFYGQLVKTAEGRDLLLDKGHFADFAAFIREHGLEDSDAARMAQLKSVLWAVGHIGSTSDGLTFLEDEDIVGHLVTIATSSLCFSVKGTCLHVLGLIASTTRGTDLLVDHGWEAATTALGEPIGLCIPVDLASVVQVPPSTPFTDLQPLPQLPRASTHAEREACVALANLTNHLLTHKSSKTLAKLRTRSLDLFTSPEFFYRALHMLESYHYRLPARRFIFDLFNLPLTPENVGLIAEAEAKLRNSTGREGAGFDDDGLATPIDGYGWLPGIGGKQVAEFSDEEDDAVETVPKLDLAPQLVVRGFTPMVRVF